MDDYSEVAAIADNVFRAFCENELDNDPFNQAWQAYEDKHGEIQSGSEAENLAYEAMRYALARRTMFEGEG